MTSEFAKYAEQAAEIKTSGRWNVLNDKVKRLAVAPGIGNEWYAQLFGSLCYHVFSEYTELHSTYVENCARDVSVIAWRARNLLKLSIWAAFFAKSRDNARRLYEDAGRDARDIFEVFEKWGDITQQPADWIEPLRTGREDLYRRAAVEGIETLDGSYERVSDVAGNLGFKQQYTPYFKMLSKFAHPTAMQILAASNSDKRDAQRVCFFGLGCLFFAGAVAALEEVQP